jgi:hypothetical protein
MQMRPRAIRAKNTGGVPAAIRALGDQLGDGNGRGRGHICLSQSQQNTVPNFGSNHGLPQ